MYIKIFTSAFIVNYFLTDLKYLVLFSVQCAKPIQKAEVYTPG